MKNTVRLLLALFVVAAAGFATPAARADDEKEKDLRSLTIERLAKGDCPHAVRIGEGGPELLRLGSFGYLGVETTALTPELRRHFGAPEDTGVLIGRVEEGSPAEAAGLRVGDVVTRVGEDDVTSGGRLRRLVRRFDQGEEAVVEYRRDGKVATTTVAFDERPSCGLDLGSVIDLEQWPRLHLEDLPRRLENLPRLEHLLELREFDGEKLGEARERLREAIELRRLDGESLREAQEQLREALEGQDWKSHLERIREIDLTDVEERLHKAMERLRELEHEIDGQKERLHEKEDDGGAEL